MTEQTFEEPSTGRKLLCFCGYCIAIVPLLIFAASLLGKYSLLCELASNFRAYIVGLVLITAPLILLLKSRPLTIAWIVAVAWGMIGTASVYLPSGQPVAAHTKTLKIMSFNVLGTNHQYDDTVAEIKRHDPDVLVVLEFANNWQPALERIHDVYPYRFEHPRWHGFGMAIFSKLPFVDSEVMQIARNRTDNPFAVVTVQCDGRPLRIAGTHLLSPVDSKRLEIRNQQLQEIADYLGRSEVDTVLVGDFNCVPWSAFLSEFLKQTSYRDSRQGFGYQGSWHARKWYLSIPIDHAFVSPNVFVHERVLGNRSGSDHYPLIVEVSLRPEE